MRQSLIIFCAMDWFKLGYKDAETLLLCNKASREAKFPEITDIEVKMFINSLTIY